MTTRRPGIPFFVAAAVAASCASGAKEPAPSLPPRPATAAAAASTPGMVAGGGIGPPVSLPPKVAADGSPQFAPDGRRLVFAGRVGDRSQIFVVDRDGRNLRRVSDGRADDLDPAFGGDGKTIFFASNAAGNFDIWRMNADGTGRRNLTNTPEDERWPRPSPIEFRLEPKQSDGDDVHGSDAIKPLRYRRLLFQRGPPAAPSVWAMLEDGRFPIRLSPAGVAARRPTWSPDGLQIAYDADDSGDTVLVVGRGRVVERSCRGGRPGAPACPPFVEFTVPDPAVKEGYRSVDVTLERALEAPKDWYAYEFRVLPATRGLSAPAFFANQTALLAVKQDGPRPAELRAVDIDGDASVSLARDVRAGTAAAFSPLGTEIAWVSSGADDHRLRTAASRFYLSEVLNLYRYPELARSKPAKLAANRFVVAPGTEREFFHPLEKARYAKKGVFVTADAVLQLVHDLLEADMERAEREELRPEVQGLCDRLLRQALERLDAPEGAERGDVEDVAVHFAVAATLLNEIEMVEWQVNRFDKETVPTPVAPEEALRRLRLPGLIEDRVRRELLRVHAAALVTDEIDYTLFKPRGHYDDGSLLASFFRAVTWLGTAPLGDPDRPGPWLLTWKWMEGGDLWRRWEHIDSKATLFAGPPEDSSFRDLSELARKEPALARATTGEDGKALVRRVMAMRPPNRIAGPAIRAARSSEEAKRLARQKRLFFLLQRAPPDGAWLGSFATPFVKDRQYPDPLDVMAALGSARAREIVERGELARAEAQRYAPALRAALSATAQEVAGLAAAPDLASGWLHALSLLVAPAEGAGTRGNRLPSFAASEAWSDKSLVSAVAGYALHRHQAVLWAKAVNAAEAGEGGEDLSFWKELPVEKPPRGYVEPRPRLYAWLAALARRLDSKEARSAAAMLERLRGIAERELAGKVPSAEEYAWIDEAGAAIEHYYVPTSEAREGISRSPDRLKYGVKIAADIFTNLNENRVLEIATGDVNAIYVATPHGAEQLLTEGGVYSIYVFTRPVAERLDDKTWGDMVDAGKAPLPPSWTRSMVEQLK